MEIPNHPTFSPAVPEIGSAFQDKIVVQAHRRGDGDLVTILLDPSSDLPYVFAVYGWDTDELMWEWHEGVQTAKLSIANERYINYTPS